MRNEMKKNYLIILLCVFLAAFSIAVKEGNFMAIFSLETVQLLLRIFLGVIIIDYIRIKIILFLKSRK